jgi:DNA-binding HxlR family transcriptional regulator
MRRADLKSLVAELSPLALSRHLTRMRHIGLIKRVNGTYRCDLTRSGRAAVTSLLPPH